MADKEPVPSANPGYALGQLTRALWASESHADEAAKARALEKLEKWTRVFSGMISGQLQVGSRTPLAGTPAWATLEVAAGGFATGSLLAGGPLRPHETERLGWVAPNGAPNEGWVAPNGQPTGEARATLNASYLNAAGLTELKGLLQSGRYRIEVPEEGALLVVAWLIDHQQGDTARALLEEIAPFFSRLRFYPLPAERPLTLSAMVHVQTVKEVMHGLDAVSENERTLLQRAVLEVWNPLYDRLVALFAETVAGPLPAVSVGKDGRPLRGDKGAEILEGGWPCQKYPDGWRTRAKEWLSDYTRLRARHRPCRRLERPHENGTRLREYLGRCAADPRSLQGRDVAAIRRMLALIGAARGMPGSPRCQALRQAEARHAKLPTRRERALLVRDRLAAYPQDEGLQALDAVLSKITEQESARTGFPSGRGLPKDLQARVRRCLDAPIEMLLEQRLIPSGEVLARVIPQLGAQVGAAGIADEPLRRLYTALYQAFRRRRSLLLLNLDSQVRLHELPWVAAINRFRSEDAGTQASARRTLTEVVRLSLTAFPHVILPNKLLTEIAALCQRADVKVPIVEEIAADIFMGEFTEKYLHAAWSAAALLKESLYERYYGISYARVLALNVTPPPSKKGPGRATELYKLCLEMAGEEKEGRGSVARNGRILEQAQILTTHNLAPLWQALHLGEQLLPELPQLVQRCFTFICDEQQRSFSDFRLRLHMLKNTAYAWRQMLFFLSLSAKAEVESFLRFASAHLQEQPAAFQEQFSPTLAGLARTAAGTAPEGRTARFLGWKGST